jgi:hypothetical protein
MASKETVVRTTHPIAIRATLPKAKVIKMTLVDSGACGFSPHAGKDRHTTPLVPPHCKDITNEATFSEAFRKKSMRNPLPPSPYQRVQGLSERHLGLYATREERVAVC